MKKLWLFSMVLLFSGSALAQKQEIKFESISVQQGLSDRSINCIIQDHLGFMWIGGSNGLYRYDGYNFLTYRDLPGCQSCPPLRNVYSLLEDEFGLIWILSDMGVAIFDPVMERSVVLYPALNDLQPDDFRYFPNLLLDKYGNIWAPFAGELIRISVQEEIRADEIMDLIFSGNAKRAFRIDEIPVLGEEATSDNYVTMVFEDQQGTIFAGCHHGLYMQHEDPGKFVRLDTFQDGESIPVQHVRDMTQLSNDKYLIATTLDLVLMESIDFSAGNMSADSKEVKFHSQVLADNQTPVSLLVDSRNNCYLGTNKELYKVEINSDMQFRFEAMGSKSQELGNVPYNIQIRDIFEDRSGVIWLAQDYDGITKYNLDQVYFTSYQELVQKNFKSSDINPIQVDQDGNLWIGTYGGGLNKVLPDLRVIQYDLLDQRNNIVCMSDLDPDLLWLGLSNGIMEFNVRSGISRDPLPDNALGAELRSSAVTDILKDSNFILLASSTGLYVYDVETEQLKRHILSEEGSDSVRRSTIISLCRRANGEILATSASEGIFSLHIDPDSRDLEWVPEIHNETLLDLGIDLSRGHTLYEDKQGQVWLTSNPGINRIDIEKGEIQSYSLSEAHEFPNARSLIEDDRGYFWIGTQYGLIRFSRETGEAMSFTVEDGLPINIHGLKSVCRKSDGNLVFGGIGGFYEFHPDSLKINQIQPPVVITSLILFNEQPGADTSGIALVRHNLSYRSSFDLKYNQNEFSIEFASMDYHNPLKNRYAYKMDGYQEEWLETNALNRQALYYKLKPGKYTFRVKASNGDLVWNEEGDSLAITVHQPWWFNAFAWIAYILLLVILIWVIIRWRLWRLKIEKRELETKVKQRTEEIEAQKEEIRKQRDLLEQQNRKIRKEEWLRSRFFENVSHEFRTPLTLIQNPVEELLEGPEKKDKERRRLRMVLRNTRRLQHLVNQLLDISRLDASDMKLELLEGDVMVFLKEIGSSFLSMAEVKSMVYRCHYSPVQMHEWYDPDKLDKVVSNLLSNAFKYTEEGGEITFSAAYIPPEKDAGSSGLELVIKDTGIGISEEDQQHIYDRFYQVEHRKLSEIQGTGIGLSLVMDLVKLMRGEIEVQSEVGKGSTFMVRLPLGRNHLEEAEYTVLDKDMVIRSSTQFMLDESEIAEAATKDTDAEKDHPVVLLVEDNSDLRTQLRESLENHYRIIEAVDGLAGERKAQKMIPDLIITDIMMPKMDGRELSKRIRSNELTSHIPIIMLTALDTLDDKISGLQTGVDDYISKPFQMAELKARISNLIRQREMLKERFSREITLEPSEITVTPLDEKLLRRAIEIVETHMKEEDFSLEIFRQEMNLSRSSLSRKLQALTGQSPTEFIRTIRIKRAASLLGQNFGSVTEVAFEVGFNNLSYFNRTFKKQFGVSPSLYLNNRK